ncbi:tetratricopeptide repeat protein [Paractinoplanes durhamensis]|uniref:Tetratricopeptide repeat protein n=1 Tax=Paractinoplanes durhamensis TaxID=113563 RepID=A0ABQ3Z0V4_9ACTN|nr:tetratricopeptide repeat protein [Actinoplanes durhamensis]GIE03462.1 hypothetical protein Adu01nite_48120 [Actinoplanes durhamensis]
MLTSTVVAALNANVAYFGGEYLRVARSYINLAQLMSRIDWPGQARPHQARAAAIVEGIFGPDHPATIAALDDLTKILIDLDLPHEARASSPTVAGGRRRRPRHRQSRPRHADARPRRGPPIARHLEQARDLIREALSISETSYGPVHPDVAIGLNNLAVVTSRIDGHAAAAQILRKA